MSDTKMETYFSFIKDCILKFDYPLAHSMSGEEFGEIFKPSNRCFLICWLLKLLDSIYEEVLESSEKDKEILGNIVYGLGFCTHKEKMPFMAGELPVDEQVRIIYNMFTFLLDIKTYNTSEEAKGMTNEELTTLINTNLNLFPMYGDIKLLRPTEKSSKLTGFEKEIVSIKTQCSLKKKPEAINLSEKCSDIEKFLEELRVQFPTVKVAVESFNKNKEVKTNSIKIHPDSVEILRKCSENLKIILQFIKDINIINDFKEATCKTVEKFEEQTDETYDMLKILHQEVLTVQSILGYRS